MYRLRPGRTRRLRELGGSFGRFLPCQINFDQSPCAHCDSSVQPARSTPAASRRLRLAGCVPPCPTPAASRRLRHASCVTPAASRQLRHAGCVTPAASRRLRRALPHISCVTPSASRRLRRALPHAGCVSRYAGCVACSHVHLGLCVAVLHISASKSCSLYLNAESSVFLCDTETQSPHLLCILR